MDRSFCVRKSPARVAALAGLISLVMLSHAALAARPQPNIILILADDNSQ